MKQKPTKKVPAVSLAQDVYEKLLEKLVNGELVPGHILNRREVAAELGVSVAPVLEAILQLELEGFVETLPRKGTIVKPVEENDFYDQLVLREALECEAARLYCGATVRENFEQLQTLAIAVDGSEAGDPSRWQNEINFHATLVSLSLEAPALLRQLHCTRVWERLPLRVLAGLSDGRQAELPFQRFHTTGVLRVTPMGLLFATWEGEGVVSTSFAGRTAQAQNPAPRQRSSASAPA